MRWRDSDGTRQVQIMSMRSLRQSNQSAWNKDCNSFCVRSHRRMERIRVVSVKPPSSGDVSTGNRCFRVHYRHVLLEPTLNKPWNSLWKHLYCSEDTSEYTPCPWEQQRLSHTRPPQTHRYLACLSEAHITCRACLGRCLQSSANSFGPEKQNVGHFNSNVYTTWQRKNSILRVS